MSRDLIALGAVLLLGVGAVLVFYPMDSSSNQADPIITVDETPAPHFPETSRPTSEPTTTNSTIKKTTTTTLEEEIYYDVLRGGTFKTGDKVSYLGEEGILTGDIEAGKVTSGNILLTDKTGEISLRYVERDYPDLGHVEMLSYPQRGEKGEVYLEINGVDSGCVFPSGFTFDLYVANLDNEKLCS